MVLIVDVSHFQFSFFSHLVGIFLFLSFNLRFYSWGIYRTMIELITCTMVKTIELQNPLGNILNTVLLIFT